MDPKDLRTLKILEKIDNDVVPSQRDLARDLNISLGLVNSFIKRLVKKGYFKARHIPKNRMRYFKYLHNHWYYIELRQNVSN